MAAPARVIHDLIAFEEVGSDRFRVEVGDDPMPRLYGGQLVVQAIGAAGRTVEAGRPIHSLHSYFLRMGRPGRPIIYEVERVRDGRSFSNRRVLARQDGDLLLSCEVSFHVDESGLDHQVAMPATEWPESLPAIDEARGSGPGFRLFDLLEIRVPHDIFDFRRRAGADEHRQLWFRASAPLGNDPLSHATLLGFASDLMPTLIVISRHGVPPDHFTQHASVDHAVWFHRPLRSDRWLCYDQASPSAHGGRGFFSGRIFSMDGVLVASVVQEVLIRPGQPNNKETR